MCDCQLEIAYARRRKFRLFNDINDDHFMISGDNAENKNSLERFSREKLRKLQFLKQKNAKEIFFVMYLNKYYVNVLMLRSVGMYVWMHVCRYFIWQKRNISSWASARWNWGSLHELKGFLGNFIKTFELLANWKAFCHHQKFWSHKNETKNENSPQKPPSDRHSNALCRSSR